MTSQSHPTTLLTSLVAEISEKGGRSTASRTSIRENFARYERFCLMYGVDTTPCTEQVVLAFLESQRPRITHSYASAQVDAIAAAHDLAGLGYPSLPSVRRYLQALRKDPDTPPPQVKVSALQEDAADAMLEQLALSFTMPGRGGHVARTRTAVVLARLMDPAPATWRALGLAVDALAETTTAGSSAVTLPRPSLLTDELLSSLRTHDLAGGNFEHTSMYVGRAAKRAGVRVPTPGAIAALSPHDFDALVAHCDHRYARDARDLAYLVLGLSAAFRHISLANLAIEDITVTPTGFVAISRMAKLAPGKTLVKFFDHLDTDAQMCADLLCPACALERQLDQCRRHGRGTGPVLATFYGGKWDAMTRQNGRLRVLKIFTEAELATDSMRIATRTLRRTAATWACHAGMPLEQVAEEVTDHIDLATLGLYIDRGPRFEVHPVYS